MKTRNDFLSANVQSPPTGEKVATQAQQDVLRPLGETVCSASGFTVDVGSEGFERVIESTPCGYESKMFTCKVVDTRNHGHQGPTTVNESFVVMSGVVPSHPLYHQCIRAYAGSDWLACE